MNQKLSNKTLGVFFVILVIVAISVFSYQPPCIQSYNTQQTVESNGTIVNTIGCMPTIPGINDQILLTAKIASGLLALTALIILIWIIRRYKLNKFYAQNAVPTAQTSLGNRAVSTTKYWIWPVLIAIVVIGLFILVGYFMWGRQQTQSQLSSNPMVNAVVSRMPNDPIRRADYVIEDDVVSLLVGSGPYQTAHKLSYSGYCSTASAQALVNEIAGLNTGGLSNVRCADGDKTLVIASSFRNGKYICDDSSGYHSDIETSLPTGELCK